MKKLISLLLAAVLLLSLLSGCGGTTPPEQPEGPAETPEQPGAQEQPDEPGQQEETPAPNLLTAKEALDAAGILWYIPNETLEEDDFQDLYIFDENKLLLTRFAYSGDPYGGGSITMHLALLSLETGELLHETELEKLDSAEVQVCEENIAVMNWTTSTIYVLDSTLTLVREYTTSEVWYATYLSPDASTAYILTEESGIRTIDLETGAESVQLETARDLYASMQCGDQLSFSCVDLSTQFMTYGALDLREGSVQFLPFDGSFYGITLCGDVWLGGVMSTDQVYQVGNEAESLYLRIDGGSLQLLDAGDEVLLFRTEYSGSGDFCMTLYGPDGSFLSSAAQPIFRDAYCTTPVWSERYGGYFLTLTTYEGETQLLFWDLSVPMLGTDLEAVTLEETKPESGSVVAQELYERAAELSQKYGVTVRIAEQCATEYYTYYTEQNTDYWTISTGLDMLDEVLSQYPAGFMEQLKYGVYREIEINLTGALTPIDMPEDANGFTSFIAFVEQQESKTIMVLDIREGFALKQHIYHEMSHIIDRKLEFDAMYREDARFSEETWASYNPEAFDYEWDYHELSDGIYWDGYDAYFIDTYARTFPTEDRARILEYAMAGHHYPFGEGSPLREKLAYYAECIRDGFDTTGWPETTLWEEPLHNG